MELQASENTVIRYRIVTPYASRIGEAVSKARDYITDLWTLAG